MAFILLLYNALKILASNYCKCHKYGNVFLNTTSNSCNFCQILSEQSTDKFLFKDETCFAIRDINPVAKVHFLVIPNIHLTFSLPSKCFIKLKIFHFTILIHYPKLLHGNRMFSYYGYKVSSFSIINFNF